MLKNSVFGRRRKLFGITVVHYPNVLCELAHGPRKSFIISSNIYYYTPKLILRNVSLKK